MPTRRSILHLMSLSAVIVLASPIWTLPANAKDKEKGNSRNDNGHGMGGGNGQGGGNSSGTGNAEPPAASAGTTAVVKHRNGLEESVVRGRYIMKDHKGRTIVNRPASRADRERLETLRR